MTCTVERVEEMTPEYRTLVQQLLESQGYREIMAANLFGHALKYIPDLRTKRLVAQQLVEELEHFEAVAALYAEVAGGDLYAAVSDRLSRIPYPESWLELAMAQFLFDRAGEFHLREYRTCSYAPYARIIAKILDEEAGHEGFGEQVVRRFCTDPARREEAQQLFTKWLRVALLSFGRPGTPGNRYAIAMGLKTRDSGEIMQDFLNDIKPTMVACGLQFPPPEALGVELPPQVDLRLPAPAA
ncbi:MAG: hypothetical protein KatS3mg131_3210 [Candidatus Tectimicrobiota bacterium]|nr:MAG: hypothetical protein KatS3mg131_3210 [Candidatus Tectomicrobia bacterium]